MCYSFVVLEPRKKMKISLFSSRAAALVSRVSRLRRSRARTLLLLNLKKREIARSLNFEELANATVQWWRSLYICVIDQAYQVKMAVYWPGNFLLFLWTKTKLRSTTVADRGEAPPPPSLFRSNWGPKGREKIFRPPPPLISGSGWKVWIRYWTNT